MLQQVQPTSRFSNFALKTALKDIPHEAVERVQDLVLDLIGVGAASTDLTASQIGRETALRLFNAGPG